MKRVKLLLAIFSMFIISSCEKNESLDSNIVKVRTGKPNYLVNSRIDVKLINNTGSLAKHFICDNSDLAPSKILKYENTLWLENDFPLLCTAMGPSGFLGELNDSETKNDTIVLFNEIGTFKMRYTFVIGNDTLEFDSNKFTVNGLEL